MEKYNEEIQLKDILIQLSDYKIFLFNKKFSIIAFSIFFSFLCVLYSINVDKRYTAELTFVVEGHDGAHSSGMLSGLAGQFGINIGGNISGNTFSQSNVIELLKSRGVIVSALMQRAYVSSKETCLIEHYHEINQIKTDEHWDDYDFLREISLCNGSGYIHDSISGVVWQEIIENDLFISLQSDDANIITLSYTSLNQEFSKKFVEVLINEMGKMYIAHETAQSNNTLEFLQARADSVFLELEVAEKELARVKDINQRIVKVSGRLRELQLVRNVEVLSTMYLEIVKNLELSKITLLNKTPIINVIDKPVLPLEDNEISISLAAIFGLLLGAFLSLIYFIFKKLASDSLTDS